jgi:hypothetical protein
MGVPTSEVGYTTAMPRREDHEVHKDMWWHWIKRNIANDGKAANNYVFRPLKGHLHDVYLVKMSCTIYNVSSA